MSLKRTPEGKMVLYDAHTGQRREFWPVDGRGLMASGEFTATPPGEPETVLATDAATVSATSQPPEPPAVHPLGVPMVVTQAHEAPAGKPMAEPIRVPQMKGRR
jgi:hypothetical protein